MATPNAAARVCRPGWRKARLGAEWRKARLRAGRGEARLRRPGRGKARLRRPGPRRIGPDRPAARGARTALGLPPGNRASPGVRPVPARTSVTRVTARPPGGGAGIDTTAIRLTRVTPARWTGAPGGTVGVAPARITRRSPLIAGRPSRIARRSPLIAGRPSRIARRRPRIARRPPLIAGPRLARVAARAHGQPWIARATGQRPGIVAARAGPWVVVGLAGAGLEPWWVRHMYFGC